MEVKRTLINLVIVKFDKSNLKIFEGVSNFYSPVHDIIYVGSQLEVYNSKSYDNREIPLEDFCANKVMLHHVNCNANFTGDIANFAEVAGIHEDVLMNITKLRVNLKILLRFYQIYHYLLLILNFLFITKW